ncbi:MAG: hypothetical protein ACETWQ_01830 [Phycisphaerae bacterium]
MSTRRILFGFLVCFSIAVFAGQTLSQTRGYGGMGVRSERGRLRNIDRTQKQPELEQRRLKLQQLKKQMGLGKSEKELMKQILRATEEQWKAIEPKFNKVREFRSLANVSIELMCYGVGGGSMSGSSVDVNKGVGRGSGYGFGGTGTLSGGQKRGSAGGSLIHYSWEWVRPSRHKGFENLNEGEKICEELFRLLEDKNSELEQIRQKMEALRKFRQEAKKELAIAQQELRQLVTPHQEAALVMMQLLD